MMRLFETPEMAVERKAPRVENLVTLSYHRRETIIRY